MTKYQFSMIVGKRLCELFGIDPVDVLGITVKARVDALTTVTVERFTDKPDDDTVITQQFQVVPMEGEGE